MPQPRLDELFVKYLQERSVVASSASVVRESEVEPYQAASLAIVDSRQAFKDAIAAVGWLIGDQSAVALQAFQPPPDWARFVHDQDTVVAVPFCVGHYPQMLRDVAPLLVDQRPSSLLTHRNGPKEMNDVAAWGGNMLQKRQWAQAVLAAAVLRMAGQCHAAGKVLGQVRASAPPVWDGVLRNEEAALAWASDDARSANRLWEEHPLADSPPVLFNRGLTALFADRLEVAETLLRQAAEKLPETSAWYHLGQLYLALARK